MPEYPRSMMQDVLRSIYRLRTQTYELAGFTEPTAPGRPAAEGQIRAVEAALGRKLPPCYRMFLSMVNGWQRWSGDVALLSTEQMLGGEYAERIREWKEKQAAAGNLAAERALVIGFSLFVGEQIFIDGASKSGEEIVLWDFGEIERYTDFFQYLTSRLEVLRSELEPE